MSIFKDSYETTIGSVFVTKNIKTAIIKCIINNYLNDITLGVISEGEYKPIFITGCLYFESEIPLFTHPIIIIKSHNEKYLCSDLRLYLKKDPDLSNIDKSIKNATEFNFVKNRTILNLLWLNGLGSDFNVSLYFASTVFTVWLTDVITKTYALDFKDQSTLSVITSFYYQSLFIDDEIDENKKQRMAIHTIKTTKLDSKFIFEIFDKITPMKGIDDYINNVISIINNPRLEKFNLPVLLTLVKNSWYGTNSQEIISVSIEHPPTWISMIYSALTEYTYKTSNVFKIAERYGKRGLADEFIKNYKQIIASNISSIATEEIEIKEFE
jgi:hypothetical protein